MEILMLVAVGLACYLLGREEKKGTKEVADLDLRMQNIKLRLEAEGLGRQLSDAWKQMFQARAAQNAAQQRLGKARKKIRAQHQALRALQPTPMHAAATSASGEPMAERSEYAGA